jgi:hypothetical protein
MTKVWANASEAMNYDVQSLEEGERQKKLDSVQDWPEAVRWVGHAVKRESERLIIEGDKTPQAYSDAEALRSAWERILRG